MSGWSRFSPEELERRRAASVAELRRRDRAAWDATYQETCDNIYWSFGKCCAGCDHWASDGGLIGTCAAAGIVSGRDVIRSTGATYCSYTPPPGLPFSNAKFYCGKFKDDFDWSTLEPEYLSRIGAMKHGAVKAKPRSPITPKGPTP